MANMFSCLQGCFKTCFSCCPCLYQDRVRKERRLSSSKDSSKDSDSDSDKKRSYSQSQEAETTHSLTKDVVLSATRQNLNNGLIVCAGQSEARSELMSAKRGGTTATHSNVDLVVCAASASEARSELMSAKRGGTTTTLSSGDADKQPPTELYYADSVQVN